MTARRRGVALTPMETRLDVIVQTAVLADELGYEVFALPEGWGLDSTTVLTKIALGTRRIQVASSVLSVWGRTPATLAMTAATLQQISGGRYVLGLGASTKALVEGFHDAAFEDPAGLLRDVVTKVRALLAGQPARLDHAPAAFPLRLGQPPPAPEVPIWVAALGPRTLQVAAELGDGWVPVMVARDHLAGWVTSMREAAAPASPDRGGRAPDRGRRRRRRGPVHRGELCRLVPDRHGRRLRPVRVRSGLWRRGQRHHRREPAAQPAAGGGPG